MVLKRIIIVSITLIFFNSCDIDVYNSCPDYEPFQTGLWQLNLITAERQLIDFNDRGIISNVIPSNTQNRILYKSDYSLFSMNIDGSDKQEIHYNFSDPGYEYALSSDDKKILFVSEYDNYFLNPDSSESNSYRDSRSELLILNIDGTDISTIRIDSTNRLRNDYWKYTNYYEPSFFSDTSIIHRTDIEKYSIDQNYELSDEPYYYDSGIWLTNILTSDQQRVTKSIFESNISDYDVSENQQLLTFQTYKNGNVIYLQNVMDSTSATIIANGRSPQFSPDSKYIGFVGLSNGGLWVYNVQTTKKKIITPEEQDIDSFTFTADSEWIIYTYTVPYVSDRGIAKIKLDGTGYQKLADEKDHNFEDLYVDDISELSILNDKNLIYTASGFAFIECE